MIAFCCAFYYLSLLSFCAVWKGQIVSDPCDDLIYLIFDPSCREIKTRLLCKIDWTKSKDFFVCPSSKRMLIYIWLVIDNRFKHEWAQTLPMCWFWQWLGRNYAMTMYRYILVQMMSNVKKVRGNKPMQKYAQKRTSLCCIRSYWWHVHFQGCAFA